MIQMTLTITDDGQFKVQSTDANPLMQMGLLTMAQHVLYQQQQEAQKRIALAPAMSGLRS